MILLSIGATCKVQHLLEGSSFYRVLLILTRITKLVAITGDPALVRGNLVFQHKTCLKGLMYLHLCCPCILFQKTNQLKFVPSEITYVYTEFLMLHQQVFLYTQVQVAPLVIK